MILFQEPDRSAVVMGEGTVVNGVPFHSVLVILSCYSEACKGSLYGIKWGNSKRRVWMLCVCIACNVSYFFLRVFCSI